MDEQKKKEFDEYVDKIVQEMDSSKKKRESIFKAVYGHVYDEMHEDWNNDSYEAKKKFIKKYLSNEDLLLMTWVLKQSKGNPLKVIKMMKDIKKYGKEKYYKELS